MTDSHIDLTAKTLGPCLLESPMARLIDSHSTSEHHVDEGDRVLLDDTVSMLRARGVPLEELPSFEPGGPRRRVYFDPASTRVGVVTCGGLCPGLNDVLRGLVLELTFHYGVQEIYGFRNGYQGFIESYGHDIVRLDRTAVRGIGETGGCILGTSRGQQDADAIVDTLERLGINILFVVGGDGTMRGGLRISKAVERRGLKIAVVGVPKTIDNDIPYIDQSFGFQTAFSEASESIRAAHVEAQSSPHGVGLVRLMGRHSGFIACYAALARNEADYVLIPEVPFQFGGEFGLLEDLRRRVEQRGHAVVVVAEGAGQEFLAQEPDSTDASGNVKLKDIGLLVRRRIEEHFDEHRVELNLKYIDPSYMIRSVPANAYDSVYCVRLAHAAVHAAMAGRTEIVVGRWHGRFVHVPMSLAISRRNTVDPHGDLWRTVLEATGQPIRWGEMGGTTIR